MSAELTEFLSWAAIGILLPAITFAAIYIARWEIRESRQKDRGPRIGYTVTFTHGPEPGHRYRVTSVQGGFVVLEELEE